jgi:tRNA-dihydrouridine synthase
VVHGRTRQDFFKGNADWAAIRPVVDAVKIPVIANGDIANAADARNALAVSGAAGVMVGRATQGKPWLAAALAHALENGGEIVPPSPMAIRESLIELCADSCEFYGPLHGARIARKHIASTLNAALNLNDEERRAARMAVFAAADVAGMTRAIEDAFDRAPQTPMHRLAA